LNPQDLSPASADAETTAIASTRGRVQHLAEKNRALGIDGPRTELLSLPIATLADLSKFSESLADIAVIRCAINERLVLDFGERYLSPLERQQLEPALVTAKSQQLIPASFHEKWDKYLIDEAAEQTGARILLSDNVVARIWAWSGGGEISGIWKLRKLFKKIEKFARVRLREGKPGRGSITDQDQQAMTFAVPQIEELQERLRRQWPESLAGIRTFVATEIQRSYELLWVHSNAEAISNLLRDDRIALDFRGDDLDGNPKLTAIKFYIKLVAWSKNRSEESVRQDLYRKSACKPRRKSKK
jgi:hypothetical protein